MVTFLCRLPLAKSHMAHLVGKGVILHTLLKHVLQATGAKDHKDSRWVMPEPAPKSRLQPKTHWNCACPSETMVLRMIAWSSCSTFFFLFSSWLLFLFYFQLQNISLLRKKKKQNYPFFYAELTVWDFAGKDGSYLISSVGLSTWRRVFLPTMEIMMYMPLL